MSISTRPTPDMTTDSPATAPDESSGTPEAALSLRLLGAFHLAVGGQPIPETAWRLRKARSLVKLLALHPTQRLPREQVLDLLWPDLDPVAAYNNLRGALHNARRVIAPRATITNRDGIIALQAAGPIWLDSYDFERAAALARRSNDPNDYLRALDLYTGELLPEDRYEDWTVAPRDRLRGLHLDLLLELGNLHEAAADWPAAIATLQRALAIEPIHEEAHLGLMRLYALAGQRARALRQWDQLTAALRRDLDAEPDLAAQRLHNEIVAGTFPPQGTSTGQGQVGRHKGNLPIPPNALIGREADLLAVKAAFAQARLLTLTGAGGCGKTRLALAAATDLLAAYPGGVWLVELAALADPALVPNVVAAVLGVREERDRPLIATLGEALRLRPVLLLLDNCEHLRDACAALAATLLATAPGLRVLATSRAALGLPGEAIWRVPSLLVPEALPTAVRRGDLTDLAAVPAVRFFLEHVRQRQPAFTLTPANAHAIAEIARRLDGIPLALELAAARAASLPVEELATRLDDTLRLLSAEPRGAAPRHQTLRATLDWSYALLDSPQRTLLRRLSVFAGGCTLAAIEAVCAEGRREKGEVRKGPQDETLSTLHSPLSLLDALADLADHSLVQANPDDAAGRYGLLETVRQYAGEQFATSGEATMLRERHAAHYLALAEEFAPHLAVGLSAPWLARLARDHDNLRAALAWLIERGDTLRALRLVGALWRLWYFGGHAGEGRRWCATVLALPADASDPAFARPLALALHAGGRLAYLQGDLVEARALCDRSLAIQQRADDRIEIARLLITLGGIALGEHRYEEAGNHYEASLALARELGDRSGIATALTGLGLLAVYGGDYPRAQALYEEALAEHRLLGDNLRVALVLNNLAEVVEYLGDFPRAEAIYLESLTLYRDLGNSEGVAMASDNLGVTLRGMGAYDRAVPYHEQGLAHWRDLGNRWRVALALTNLGATLYHLGEHDRAVALHTESLDLFRALNNGWGCALALENLGHVAWALGDQERAVAHLTESLALYRQIDNSGGIIITLCGLGQAARVAGDTDHALTLYREALARCQQAHDRSRLPAPLEGLATLAAARGALTDAARLFGAAAALRAAVGKPLAPIEHPAYAATVASVKAALGDDAFAAAWTSGQALDPDAAITSALTLVPGTSD